MGVGNNMGMGNNMGWVIIWGVVIWGVGNKMGGG